MTDTTPTNVGRTNVYICEKCRYAGVTIDRDPGVTPVIIGCLSRKKCDGRAYSTMYRAPTNLEPVAEWYRPSDEEIAGKSQSVKDHVSRGGLLLRLIQTSDERKMLDEAVSASLLK